MAISLGKLGGDSSARQSDHHPPTVWTRSRCIDRVSTHTVPRETRGLSQHRVLCCESSGSPVRSICENASRDTIRTFSLAARHWK